MSYLDPMETPAARVSPALMMGVASPLWGYFGAATAGGLAFWWMTRWTRPVNLEAMFAGAAEAAAPVLEPMIEAIEVMSEVVAEEPETLVAAALALEPATPPEPEPEPEALAAPEPLPEPVAVEAEAVAEVVPPVKARPKKVAPPTPEPEA